MLLAGFAPWENPSRSGVAYLLWGIQKSWLVLLWPGLSALVAAAVAAWGCFTWVLQLLLPQYRLPGGCYSCTPTKLAPWANSPPPPRYCWYAHVFMIASHLSNSSCKEAYSTHSSSSEKCLIYFISASVSTPGTRDKRQENLLFVKTVSNNMHQMEVVC